MTALVLSVLVAASPLARLADRLSEEVVRVAQGRSVEVSPVVDRTSRGDALDFASLLKARLATRPGLAEDGPRLRIEAILSEAPSRLVVSARVLEVPSEHLVDIVSASTPLDPTQLPFHSAAVAGSPGPFEVVSRNGTGILEEAVLAVTFLGSDRLAVLTASRLNLYRLDGSGLSLESSAPLPGPVQTVRLPSGMLSAGEDSVWALTNQRPKAVLFAVEGRRLVQRAEAEKLPSAGIPGGLSYRPGTNLVEASLAGLGEGPYLAVLLPAAVAASGELRGAGPPPRTVGPTLAWLWPGVLAASSAAPPGTGDAIVVVGPEGGGSIPVEGSVRALAAHRDGSLVRLVAALDDDGSRLLCLDLRRP